MLIKKEKNKIAATKYRNKKKKEKDQLLKNYNFIINENKILKNKIETLVNHIKTIKELL